MLLGKNTFVSCTNHIPWLLVALSTPTANSHSKTTCGHLIGVCIHCRAEGQEEMRVGNGFKVKMYADLFTKYISF